jgi:heat shock protein HslJ
MRKLFLVLTVALIGLCVASCSSSSDNENAVDETTQKSFITNPSFNVSYLFGTWKIDKASADGGKSFVEFDEFVKSKYGFTKSTTATFKRDGTYSGSGYFGDGTGNYTINQNTITTYIGGVEYYSYRVISYSEKTCDLQISSKSSTAVLVLRCVKQ